MPNNALLPLSILPQPNGISCGPTCLHALYRYFKDNIPLGSVISETAALETGGTWAVLLGIHALTRGYKATLHTLNLYLIDPSWFGPTKISLIDKLREQLTHASDQKIIAATQAYLTFLELGGEIKFGELHFNLIKKYLDNQIPLLSGLSATYFYQEMRDYTNEQNQAVCDEWKGSPSGHFVVLRGYENRNKKIYITDPYAPDPLSRGHDYTCTFSHWLHAHLLGATTFDSELLAIWPASQMHPKKT